MAGCRYLAQGGQRFLPRGLMAWCEANGVHYVFGLARNARLETEIADELAEAERKAAASGKAERVFKEFQYQTRSSWSKRAPRRGQGRASRQGRQSALHRHLTDKQDGQRAGALREDLLRPRRHGKPHQGVPTRPDGGPHLGGNACGRTSSGCGFPRSPMCW